MYIAHLHDLITLNQLDFNTHRIDGINLLMVDKYNTQTKQIPQKNWTQKVKISPGNCGIISLLQTSARNTYLGCVK